MGCCPPRARMRAVSAATLVFTLVVISGSMARAQVGAELVTDFGLNNLATEGVTSIQYAPGRPNDLFVGVLDGRIMRVDLTDNSVSTYATIPDIDLSGPSGMFGMTGFTFHPDFQTNGQIYTYVADDRNADDDVHHRNYVRRYDVSDPASNAPSLGPVTDILREDWPLNDHNGGFLGFQPGDNNTLWISTGDGGNNDGDPDPSRSGQNPFDLRGSILRIDISEDDFPGDPTRNYGIPENNPFADGVDGAPEVWSYGIRSPWGGSFDRATGDFIFGDVGQVTIEEVNFERAGSAGGRNYGWRVKEGSDPAPFEQDDDDLPANHPSFIDPVLEYEHSGGYGAGNSQPLEGRSVTGGVVYRGPIESLEGQYIFGDWSSRQVWAAEIDRDANGGLGGIVPDSHIDLSEALGRDEVIGVNGGFGDGVTAFGEDLAGNVYFAELNGTLFKICDPCEQPEPEPGPPPREPIAVLRDDFDEAFNYQSGDVPSEGIWSGVRNEDFGDLFDADSSNTGQLTLGMEPVGWEGGGADNAPFIYREVDADNLMEVRVRISNQTRGTWSSAGILARVAGELDDDESNDHQVSVHSFEGPSLSVSNVIAGAEGEAGTPLDEEDLTHVRMVHLGDGDFEAYTSVDGVEWDLHQEFSNEELAEGMLEVGLWAGSYGGGISDGDAQFDWVEIMVGVPAGDYNEDGVIDAADYTVWRDTMGQAVDAWEGADGDGDGMVTTADYEVWRRNYGLAATLPGGATASAAAPEPHASALLVVCAALASRRVGRRRRR